MQPVELGARLSDVCDNTVLCWRAFQPLLELENVTFKSLVERAASSSDFTVINNSSPLTISGFAFPGSDTNVSWLSIVSHVFDDRFALAGVMYGSGYGAQSEALNGDM